MTQSIAPPPYLTSAGFVRTLVEATARVVRSSPDRPSQDQSSQDRRSDEQPSKDVDLDPAQALPVERTDEQLPSY